MTEPLTETPAASLPTPGRRTIAELWRRGAARDDALPAYLVRDGAGWQEVSWRDAAERVDALANGLLALGIRKGDTLAILGSTKLEWALFDFAAACVTFVPMRSPWPALASLTVACGSRFAPETTTVTLPALPPRVGSTPARTNPLPGGMSVKILPWRPAWPASVAAPPSAWTVTR